MRGCRRRRRVPLRGHLERPAEERPGHREALRWLGDQACGFTHFSTTLSVLCAQKFGGKTVQPRGSSARGKSRCTAAVSKIDEFALKTRKFVLKTRNCVLKTRNFVFKMMTHTLSPPQIDFRGILSDRQLALPAGASAVHEGGKLCPVSKNDEFCI